MIRNRAKEKTMRIPHRWMQFLWVGLSGGVVLLGLLAISEDSYLLFHSLIELFSIIVAGSIFMIVWNARSYLDNDYFLFIGIAYFFTGIIDLLHTLAYHGMGVFATTGSNLATQLWVAGRYLQSITLLIAPLFCSRKLKIRFQILIYSIITSLLLTSIFYWRIFPVCYVEGSGLTIFKIASEYMVIAILGAAIWLLLQQRQWFDTSVLRLLVWSMVVTIAAEFAFTSYVNVNGSTNVVGHFLRLISFYLAYKAIVETGLIKPQVVLFHNLTENEERLRQQADELQARNEELDAFAHTVAHDLKNPLATLIVAVDTLSDFKVPPEEWKEYADEIIATAYHMDRIIDNLLLLAEARKNDVHMEEVDMAEVVSSVRRRLGRLISQTHAKIETPDCWPTALGHAPWVEEVLANYVSNAIKYGGQPPLIQLGADVDLGGSLRFWVQDNGCGIGPEEQAELFKPFSQRRRRGKGHGLGLSIVRHIVERMGGQTGVESAPGQGSRFYFTLKQPPPYAAGNI
jgi:signal transduction histidine kinase